MRTFIVWQEEVGGEKWDMNMYQVDSLLTLLKDYLDAVKHDYKTEEEAIHSMSTTEGGWNGDGTWFYVIGEILNNGTEFKILIQ